MKCVAGIFGSLQAADRARRFLATADLHAKQIVVLPPGTSPSALALLGGHLDEDQYLFGHALELGAAVVVVLVDEPVHVLVARAALDRTGAEPMADVCERWWHAVRAREEPHWRGAGATAHFAEDAYRQGFIAAQRPSSRGRSYTEVLEDAERRSPWSGAPEAFRLGYERGQAWGRRHAA